MTTQPQPATPKTVVKVTHRFSASAERVYYAWLDPARVGRWLFATPTGTVVRVEIDARVGGRFAIVDRRDGEDVLHTGEYLELDRPRRLVFTFGVPKYSPEFDRVTVEVAALGSGCELTLTHEVTPQWADGAKGGWEGILGALATALGEPPAAA